MNWMVVINWMLMDVNWIIMSNDLVVSFGSTYRSHLQGSRYYPSLVLEFKFKLLQGWRIFKFEVPHNASDMKV